MSQPTRYYLRDGFRCRVDVQAAGKELTRIEKKHKGATAENVVTEATDKASPLHDAFEWNNRKAGNEYRLSQARYLVRSIEIIPKERESAPVGAFTFLPVERDGAVFNVYTNTLDAMKDPIRRVQLLANAKKELASFRKKYSGLTELAGIIAAIDDYDPK